MNSVEILHDTGCESVPLRFACAAWGVFCLVAAWFAFAETVAGGIGAAVIGVAFFYVCLARAKILFDHDHGELIWKSSPFGSHRILLREAVGISSAITGVITHSAELYIHFSDGRREFVAHVAPHAASAVTKAISEATSIPVIEA